jgi:leader peptidase (prepilin peptidase) / N-methyltransferase
MTESDALADAPGALWPLAALAIGLVIGSFANVCIHRVPLGESVVAPRSRCPSCRAPIAAGDNVPILSYLVLGGRCRHCGARISGRYPAVELANGLLYLGVALRDGPSPRAAVDMALVTALLVLSLIDLDHQILPNVITRPGIALGIAVSVVAWRLGWPAYPSPLESIASAAGGYLAFGAVALAYRRTRGVEGLGQGDWKLAAMLGAFLGWERMLLTILLASILGTIAGVALIVTRGRSSQHPLPLGTFLGLTGIVVLFIGQPLVEWYGRLLRA